MTSKRPDNRQNMASTKCPVDLLESRYALVVTPAMIAQPLCIPVPVPKSSNAGAMMWNRSREQRKQIYTEKGKGNRKSSDSQSGGDRVQLKMMANSTKATGAM